MDNKKRGRTFGRNDLDDLMDEIVAAGDSVTDASLSLDQSEWSKRLQGETFKVISYFALKNIGKEDKNTAKIIVALVKAVKTIDAGETPGTAAYDTEDKCRGVLTGILISKQVTTTMWTKWVNELDQEERGVVRTSL